MRVTRVETFLCAADWRNFVFVRVDTDEGLHGWGEATLEGKEQTVAAATGELARYLIGQDPARIERHWHHMYETPFWRGGPVLGSAISGLDQALWDIKGKALGVPVYELLGGAAHDRIRYYANGWFHGATTIDEVAAAASAAVARGATALKWDPFGAASLFITTGEIHAAVDCVAAVREAVGPTIDLMKKIAAMAEAYHIGFAPHNPNGPVATRVCQHLAAACPNFTILEWLPEDVPWRDAAMGGAFEVGDGTMPLPEGPGLGIELDVDVLRANPYVSVEMNQYHPDRRLAPRQGR